MPSPNTPRHRLALVTCFLSLLSPGFAAPSHEWDIAVLEKLAAEVPLDGTSSTGCFELRGWQLRGFRDRLQELAARSAKGEVSPNLAVQSPVTLWPGGVVYYVFDASVTVAQRRIFLDAAADLSAFAAVSFVLRTAQPNYSLVKNVPGLGGGVSAVGMVGAAQTFDIGEGSWNRGTLLHEMGHTLGLVHEHQRPDRDAFVTIQTGNILPGAESNFVVLAATTTGAYEFLSVMHYRRDSFSSGAGLDTIVPKPAYAAFAGLMGNQYNRPLSTLDRAGLAATYGPGAPASTVVTNTLAGGTGSLTVAIYRAVDAPGSTITFNIPTTDPGYDAPSGTWTIRPTDQLPKLGRLTTLDATTQPGGTSTGPKLVLDGLYTTQSSDVFAHGLELTEDQCQVRGFAIRDFDGDAILIQGAGATDNVITRCRLGCNSAGNVPASAGLSGLSIYDGARRNRIGGPAATDRNIISGNLSLGLRLAGPDVRENLVQGNFIGLRPDGSTALANANSGVQIEPGASENVLRANVISGNANYGVVMLGANVNANRLEGNFIGTDATGTAAVPNLWSGVGIFNGASNSVIGGSAAARNLISGNANNGLVISGTGVTGTGVTGTRVTGNFIGTDVSGTTALPNGWTGLQLAGGASGNTVGGTAQGQANVLSGNLQYGLALIGADTDGNLVAGNIIGLDATGTTALGNGWSGIGISSGASSNVIGGSPSARNLISGNSNYGVAIEGGGTSGNLIQSNSIGYDVTGTQLRGNAWDGVSIYGGATGNQIGGETPGLGNRIGGNAIRGIVLFSAATAGNSILGNSIADNTDLGIDIFDGANSGQTPPSLSSATMTTQLTVSLDVSGASNAAYRIEFFASSQADFGAYGEGRTFLGARPLLTDGSGLGTGTVTLPVALLAGSYLTATATRPGGDTSRFAFAATVAMTDTDGDSLPDAWESAFGQNPGNPADAALDTDGDGFSATAEYLAGTDPRVSTSRPALLSPTKSGNDLLVNFAGTNGRPFTLERSSDLQTWTLWSDSLLGTGAVQAFTDRDALAAPRRFYRARFGF